MKIFATSAAAFLAATALVATAQAADMPTTYAAPPVATPSPVLYDWTGFYVGAHAGYGWADADVDTTFLPSPEEFGNAPFAMSVEMDGLVGGLQTGYNWQVDTFVFGVEADISYSGIDGSNTVGPSVLRDFDGDEGDPDWFQRVSGEIDWFGTARVRAGIAATPELLVYATGGLAFARTEYQALTWFDEDPDFQYAARSRKTETGWTLGGGLEWAMAPNVSLKAEYLYFDLGDRSFVAPPVGANDPFAVQHNVETTGHIVRAGINYRFNLFGKGVPY